MPRLKDYLETDLNTFLNLGEFADMHDIDGTEMPGIVDSDVLKERNSRKSEQYDGVYKATLALYVKEADLGYRPVYGQNIRLDGTLYLVAECSEANGMLEIVLEANQS